MYCPVVQGGARSRLQAGVYKPLGGESQPDWVAGISIGAIIPRSLPAKSPEQRAQAARGLESITANPLLDFALTADQLAPGGTRLFARSFSTR